jgi:transposase
MKKQRKHYTPEEKVAILRRHLLEQVPSSELCDQQGLQPTGLLPLAEGVLRERRGCLSAESAANHSAEQERIAYLEKKIQTKDEVLAELMAEHVALKKRLGNSDRVWVPHDTRDQIVVAWRWCRADTPVRHEEVLWRRAPSPAILIPLHCHSEPSVAAMRRGRVEESAFPLDII